MSAKVFSMAPIGLESKLIEVEVDLNVGLPCFSIVGLPDTAVSESRERVSSAIKNIRAQSPRQVNRRVIVNLAPADLKKEGPIYDLPIAISFLLVSEQIPYSDIFEKSVFLGELSLEGKVRPIKGSLSAALMCREKGIENLFLPKENAPEAALVREVKVFGISSLQEIFNFFHGRENLIPSPPTDICQFYQKNYSNQFNLSLIKGQNAAKNALIIAAAGGHNLLMVGPPGSGKTFLARTLPTILPPLTLEESLEVTRIYSIAGLLSPQEPIITTRPFRSPHHTSSAVSLIGGGNQIKPGEITLAHRGVLFLDEFPEFHRDVLESLRQPLEDGKVIISRSSGAMCFPAKFILVAAMNPCPCGNKGNPYKNCTCTPGQIYRYRRKVSGPILDRIDLQVNVPFVDYQHLTSQKEGITSQQARQKVVQARKIQAERFHSEGILTNSEMTNQQVKKYCQISPEGKNILEKLVDQYHISARVYYRILKVARTIADLQNRDLINGEHIAIASSFRLEKQDDNGYW